MSQLLNNVQGRMKSSSSSLVLLAIKIFSGLVIGLTFALIGDEIISYGNFSFVFVIALSTFGFLRVSKNWRYTGVLVFDLICVLVGMLLRMYITLAPGV